MRKLFYVASLIPLLTVVALVLYVTSVKVEGFGGLAMGGMLALVVPPVLLLSAALGISGLVLIRGARRAGAPTRSLWAATLLASSVVLAFFALAAWREWRPRPDPSPAMYDVPPSADPRVPRAPIR